MLNSSRSLSTDQFVHALETAGRAPDVDLIHVCLERREEMTPTLLEWLADTGDESWDDDDPRWYRDIHAGHLLMAWREPAALPLFAEVFKDKERENLVEWFDTELASAYGPAAMQTFLDVLEDPNADVWGRASAAGVLEEIAWKYPAERERIVEMLRAQLPPLTENGQLILPQRPGDHVELWTLVAVYLAELHDPGSRAQIVALYEAGLMDEMVMGDVDDYLEILESDEPPLRSDHTFDIIDLYEGLHRQAQQQAQWRAQAEQRARAAEAARVPRPQAVQPQTFVRSQPKIGRNDPCPCGSGRKYKHCHGKPR